MLGPSVLQFTDPLLLPQEVLLLQLLLLDPHLLLQQSPLLLPHPVLLLLQHLPHLQLLQGCRREGGGDALCQGGQLFSSLEEKKTNSVHRTSSYASATTNNCCVPLAQPRYEPQGTKSQTLDLAAKELQRSFSHLIGESLGTFGMSLDSFGSLGSFPHLCGKSLDMLSWDTQVLPLQTAEFRLFSTICSF